MSQDKLKFKYDQFKGSEWPIFEDFLSGNWNTSDKIKIELENFQRIYQFDIMNFSDSLLEILYKEFGKNICLAPFLGTFYSKENLEKNQSQTNYIKPCCFSSLNVPIQKNSLFTSNNAKLLKDLRKNFLEKSCHDINGCENCAMSEKFGVKSQREKYNQYYIQKLDIDIVQEVKNIINNSYEIKNIYELNYIPSSYCNFECIMCGPEASSSRLNFERRFKNNKKRIYSQKLADDFYQILEKVQILHLTGGETLQQPEIYKLFNYLISNELSKNISVSVVTNASIYSTKFDMIAHNFKNILMTVSIDGIDEILEYQRRNSDSEIIKKNTDLYYKKYGAVLNCVLTAVNIFKIDELLDYLYEKKYDSVIITLVAQDYLSPAIIPDSLKMFLRNKFINKRDSLKDNFIDKVYKNLYDSVLIYLQDDKTHLLPKFVEHINYEDMASKKKLKDIIPEWAPYFQNEK